jgi:hypothetical protein
VINGPQIQEAVGNVRSPDIPINQAELHLHDDLSDRAGPIGTWP